MQTRNRESKRDNEELTILESVGSVGTMQEIHDDDGMRVQPNKKTN